MTGCWSARKMRTREAPGSAAFVLVPTNKYPGIGSQSQSYEKKVLNLHRAGRNRIERRLERLELRGLDQVVIEARRERAPAVVVPPPAGQRDQGYVRIGRQLARKGGKEFPYEGVIAFCRWPAGRVFVSHRSILRAGHPASVHPVTLWAQTGGSDSTSISHSNSSMAVAATPIAFRVSLTPTLRATVARRWDAANEP